MYGVGARAPRAKRLIDVTYEAIQRGLDGGAARLPHRRHRPCHPDLCGEHALLGWSATSVGHAGLGKVFHFDAPNILHFGQRGTGELLRPGMFFVPSSLAW